METLSRDSLYLKQRLNLNIDVQFVRQGGKEGHTTADRWTLNLNGKVKAKSKLKVKVKIKTRKRKDKRQSKSEAGRQGGTHYC